MYGIDHPVEAFFFDRGVHLFGASVEADINKAGEGKKAKVAEGARKRALAKWLNDPEIGTGFRTPVPTK